MVPTSSTVYRFRLLAGVAVTKVNIEPALPYNEPDYRTRTPTSWRSRRILPSFYITHIPINEDNGECVDDDLKSKSIFSKKK